MSHYQSCHSSSIIHASVWLNWNSCSLVISAETVQAPFLFSHVTSGRGTQPGHNQNLHLGRTKNLIPQKKATYFHWKLLQSKIWSQSFSLSRCVQTPLAQDIILSRTWGSKQPHHERWVEVPNVFLFILPIDGGNGVPLNTKWSQWQKPPGPKWSIQDKYPNTGHKGMSIYIHMHIIYIHNLYKEMQYTCLSTT